MSVKTGKKIAILGATGHIAKSLIYYFYLQKRKNVFLFARSLKRLKGFLNSIGCKEAFLQKNISQFYKHEYDVIINCVGFGTPGRIKAAGAQIFSLTEEFDSMVLDYLRLHPKAIYINLSSGAAYGGNFIKPADKACKSAWCINDIKESDYYSISKLYLEAKHRSLKDFNIVDLRIFNYFSRFIKLEKGYLLTDIILSVKNGKTFVTDNRDIKRDFVHFEDLAQYLEKCIAKKKINKSFDAYSKKPVGKFELLDFFRRKYGLKYKVVSKKAALSATGSKNNYYSNNKSGKEIGYFPKFSSLEGIAKEAEKII